MEPFKILLSILTALSCQLNIISMPEINHLNEIAVIRQTNQYIVFYHTVDNGLTDVIILYLDEAALNTAKIPQNLDSIKCTCNGCGGRKKSDRFHIIPPIVEQFFPYAYQLTKKNINNSNFSHKLEPKLTLISNEFALVIEARIINKHRFKDKLIDHQKILGWRDKEKPGHHHGAYVFIYKKDTNHCAHAMFHKTIK